MAQVSAEIRWFWSNAAPGGLIEWFRSRDAHGVCCGGGRTPRTDLYRRDGRQGEVSIKVRGSKPGFEVKGLIDNLGSICPEPFAGNAELWCKWTVEGLRLDVEDALATTKLRWIRKLAVTNGSANEVELGDDEMPRSGGHVPAPGCQFELTQVFFLNKEWWSLSFESFGGAKDVAAALTAGASLMASRTPPSLAGGTPQSYPAWLKSLIAKAPSRS